ncbi:C2 domain containing protein [Histomonas meleagridis]|uniref:C2 domain containing protein n=1 Tax=Histomonas meleagridis TaxID=135588 RepID=UPI003559E089|nr:C2 domain containing protein [Histomonas meleagridis]KAH0797196.1 C2 domain containing protein [Histomonas meleagridis]
MMQLHLRVLEATDIAKMDLFSKSDPYVIVRISGSRQERRTNYINNTSHPRWNAEFHFSVNPSVDYLNLLMRDKDAISDDDMATLNIPLSSFPPGQVIDQWYDMIPCRRVKKGGRIHLVVHVAPNGAQPFTSQPMFQQSMMAMQNTMFGMGALMQGYAPAYQNPMYNARPQPMTYQQPQPMYQQPMVYPQAQPMYPQPQPMYPNTNPYYPRY